MGILSAGVIGALCLNLAGAPPPTQAVPAWPRPTEVALVSACHAGNPEGSPVVGGRSQARLTTAIQPDGRRVASARVDDLAFRHEAEAGGHAVMRFTRGDDRVAITVSERQLLVERNGEAIDLELDSASEARMLGAQTLLAGSPALYRFRAMAATLDRRDVRTPAGIGVVLADTLVALLQGERGAASRWASRLGPGQASVRRVSDDGSCYERYEGDLMRAYNEYEGCLIDVWYLRDLCSFRYVIWAESLWFEMLGCAAVPLRQ